MIEQDALNKQQFTKSLLDDSSSYVKKVSKIKLPKGKTISPTARIAYIHQVLDSFAELQAIVDHLNMVEIFLSSYTVSRTRKKTFDENHYFTYHYEMWILNAVRLYERALILIDSVYWLEVDHREVTYTTISSHPGLDGTKTLAVLKKVHGALSKLQGLKNSVFHRYIYTDEELGNIATYNFVARNSLGDEDQKKEFSSIAKYFMRQEYRPKKLKEIRENNKQLIVAVDAILETLNEQYISHRDALDDKLPTTNRQTDIKVNL